MDLRNPSPVTWTGTLIITWLFGILIGISLGYALFTGVSRPGETLAQNPPSVQSPAPETTTPSEEPDTVASSPATTTPPIATAKPPQVSNADSIVSADAPERDPKRNPDQEIWAARHLFIAVNGQWLADGTRDFIRTLRPGGVLLREVNLRSRTQTAVLIDEIKKAAGLGEGFSDLPLIAASIDGGTQPYLALSDLPAASELEAAGDAEAARALGRRMAAEAVGRGINVLLGPTFDVYEPGGAFPDFATRSFGSDPTAVTRMGLAMADGMQAGGVIPVVKHFPGYGAATYGPDGLLVMLNKDFGGLAQTIFPFTEAIAVHTPGMLVGHVAVPALDRDNPNRSAALSPVMVRDLLRTRRGYDGVILADDVAFNPMTRTRPAERAVVEALAAGCDAVLFLDPDPERIRRACIAIEDALESGELDAASLEASRERLERWRKLLGSGMGLPPASPPEDMKIAGAPAVKSGLPWDVAPPQEIAPEKSAIESDPADAAVIGDTKPTPETPPMAEPDSDVSVPPAITAAEAGTDAETAGEMVYRVREGDTLESITRLHGVSVAKLNEWNDDNAAVTPGSTLRILIDGESDEMPAGPVSPDVVGDAENDEPKAPVLPPTGKVFHRVAVGETADDIAQTYSVAKADLMMWNDITEGALEPDSIVTVFVDPATMTERTSKETDADDPVSADAEPESAVDDTTDAEDEPLAVDSTAEDMPEEADDEATDDAGDSPAEETVTETPSIATDVYEVQSGDTLMAIARDHNTSSKILMDLNGLKDANHIFVGQELKVPARE